MSKCTWQRDDIVVTPGVWIVAYEELVGSGTLVLAQILNDLVHQASQLGRLTVLQARMNPDLAMGDELLKKTGSGNLFMVFGEPDIEVRSGGEGRLVVEVCGLDIYDPTTGEVRSSSIDHIAAWFLDTDYDVKVINHYGDEVMKVFAL